MVKERSDKRKPVGSNDKEKLWSKSDRKYRHWKGTLMCLAQNDLCRIQSQRNISDADYRILKRRLRYYIILKRAQLISDTTEKSASAHSIQKERND